MPVSSVWLVAVSMKTVLPEYETNASTRLKLNVTVSIPPNPLMPELPDGAVKESGSEVPLNTGSPGFNVDLLLPAIVEHSPSKNPCAQPSVRSAPTGQLFAIVCP